MSTETKSLVIWSIEENSCIKQESLFGWKPYRIIEEEDDWLPYGGGSIHRIEFVRETGFASYEKLCQLESRYQSCTEYKDYTTSLLSWRASDAADAFGPKIIRALGLGLAFFGACLHELSLAFTILCVIIGLFLYFRTSKGIRKREKEAEELNKKTHGENELSQLEIDDILSQAAACLSD